MAYSKRHARRRWLGHHELRGFVESIDAHETLAHAVKAAITYQVDLSELPLAVLQEFNLNIEKDVYQVLSLRGWLNARNNLGGTAPTRCGRRSRGTGHVWGNFVTAFKGQLR